MILKSRKGVIEIQEVVIFLLLNLLFFSVCFAFVYKAGSGAGYYEEIYAQKIAIALDQSRGNMTFIFSFDEPVNMAKKSGIPINDIVKIDSRRNIVTVKLSNGNGFSYQFFSDVNAFPIISGNSLKIKVENKND